MARSVREAVFDDPLGRCNMEVLCEAGGFEYRVEVLPAGPHRGEAMLVARSTGGFLIVVDPEAHAETADPATHRRRLRFRLAHEIGHSFFYDRDSHPPKREISRSKGEESFCHQFASALLVPPETAVRCQREIGSLIALRERFDVSLNVVAWALVNAQQRLSIALLSWRDHPHRQHETAMRVVWGAARNHYLPENASLDARWLDMARSAGKDGVEIPDFRLGSLRAPCRITAEPYGKGQLVLFIDELQRGSETSASEPAPNAPSEQLRLARRTR